jgi:ABC-type uncharacterized transport system substrate-binding protein
MKRRAFLVGLGSAVAWPLSARAADRVPRIGYFGPASADEDQALFEAFKAGLAEAGYIPGKTIEIERRSAEGGRDQQEDRLAALAKELVDLKIDVLVTGGPGVYAAHRATKTVPIVAAVAGDLVAVGLADSLAHPGGNVTGEVFFFPELMVKRIAFLKQVRPSMTSVGVLLPRNYSAAPVYLRAIDAPVKALGLALAPLEIAEPAECERVLSEGPGAAIGALVVMDPPQFNVGPGPGLIAAAAARHGLPSAGPPSLPRNGGLLGLGVDLPPMFRRAAYFVVKILEGTKPGDIPLEEATKFTMVVNLKTAAALGLDIPPTLLAAADEVIE